MKQAHSISTSIFILNLIFSIHSYAAPWPKLDSDFDKLTYGLQLREQLKSFFTGTANYGMEWWNITADQKQIHDGLKNIYPSAMDEKLLSVLKLATESTIDVPSPAQFGKLKLDLIQRFSQNHENQKSEEIAKELELKSKALQEIKPGELLAQLMTVVHIEADDFKYLMKAANSEKIAHLKKYLSEDLSTTSITKNSKGKFTPQQLGSGSQAVGLLEKLFAFENDVQFLTQLIVLGGPIKSETVLSDMLNTVKSAQFDRFVKTQSPTDISAIIKENLKITSPHQEATVSFVVGIFQKAMQKAIIVESIKIKTEVPYLKIVEKPRDESIMRSAVGKDCTHTCAFAKSDHPFERVFYVVDQATSVELGYIEAEVKASPLGDVLYINSINGPTLTPQQTDQILNGFYDQRAELKVKEIVLINRNLWLNMNYGDVIQHWEKLIENKKTISIESKNKLATEVIEKFIKTDYQFERENRQGVIFERVNTPSMISSSVTHVSNVSLVRQNFSSSQYLLFALELDATQRWSTQAGQLTDGERAAKAANLDLTSYRELRHQLKNSTHQNFEAYMSDSAVNLARHGIQVDKAFITQHRHLFFDGQLAAKDALEGNLQKSTLTLVSSLLKRGIWHTTWGLEEIGKNPASAEILNQSKELDSVFRWGRNDIGFHSIQFLNMVTSGLGHERFRSPEYTRELFRAVGHGSMWAPELCLKILKLIYPNSLAEESKRYAQDADPQVRDGAMKLTNKNQSKAIRCSAMF